MIALLRMGSDIHDWMEDLVGRDQFLIRVYELENRVLSRKEPKPAENLP